MIEPNDKAYLRSKLRGTRRQLDPKITAAYDKTMAANCIHQINWNQIKNLHCYRSMQEWREVDTWPILKHVWQHHPKILTAAPRILEHKQMEAVVVTPGTKWGRHVTGIPEPLGGEVLPAGFKFDLIIVPTLGFDHEGYRLGSGSGHYDRFLASQPQALKIGLCGHDGFLEKGFEHEPHDIRLDKIITEERVFSFS